MRARTFQVLTTVAVAAVLTAGAPAAATAPDVPRPDLPAPGVPLPERPPLAWDVELKDGWRSPSWKQETDGVAAVVHLDCGDRLGIRLPHYWVQLVPEDGRIRPAVMPEAVPCGVTHRFAWDDPAGAFHLLLTKVQDDGVVLRGKAEVRTSRFGPS